MSHHLEGVAFSPRSFHGIGKAQELLSSFQVFDPQGDGFLGIIWCYQRRPEAFISIYLKSHSSVMVQDLDHFGVMLGFRCLLGPKGGMQKEFKHGYHGWHGSDPSTNTGTGFLSQQKILEILRIGGEMRELEFRFIVWTKLELHKHLLYPHYRGKEVDKDCPFGVKHVYSGSSYKGSVAWRLPPRRQSKHCQATSSRNRTFRTETT